MDLFKKKFSFLFSIAKSYEMFSVASPNEHNPGYMINLPVYSSLNIVPARIYRMYIIVFGHLANVFIQRDIQFVVSHVVVTCSVYACAQQEVCGILIGEDELVVISGVEFVEWYQIY